MVTINGTFLKRLIAIILIGGILAFCASLTYSIYLYGNEFELGLFAGIIFVLDAIMTFSLLYFVFKFIKSKNLVVEDTVYLTASHRKGFLYAFVWFGLFLYIERLARAIEVLVTEGTFDSFSFPFLVCIALLTVFDWDDKEYADANKVRNGEDVSSVD